MIIFKVLADKYVVSQIDRLYWFGINYKNDGQHRTHLVDSDMTMILSPGWNIK